jgi:hypothetical protein
VTAARLNQQRNGGMTLFAANSDYRPNGTSILVLTRNARSALHSGVKMAEMTTEGVIRVNAGLKPQDLASKPADFAPDIPASTDKDQ